MPPVIPGRGRGNGRPRGDENSLELLGEHLFNAIIAKPLGFLLSIFLPGGPEDWDTLDEIRDGFESWLENIPILGDLLSMFNGTWSGGGTGASIGGFFAGKWATLQDVETVQVPRLDNRIDSLVGIGTRSTFYSNGTWTNPGVGSIAVVVFNGGRRTGEVAKGVSGAKYVFQEFNCADLPSTVAVTVGGPTAASSFGTYVLGSWTKGVIITAQGLFDGSAGDAGNGGEASNASGATLESRTGTGNYFAAGGAAGAGGPVAQPGQDAPIDKVALAGGGGGGGGDFVGGVVPRSGGNGGFPGGGAGGRPNGVVAQAVPGTGAVFVTHKG